MNNRIKTYADLEAEEKRLMGLLKIHEENIKVSIAGVKEGLKPFNKAMHVVHDLTTREKTGPVVNFGLDMGIDILLRRILLARAGWLTKVVVPFVVKNYSSHLISEEMRETITKKVKSILKKVRPQKGKKKADTETDQSQTSV